MPRTFSPALTALLATNRARSVLLLDLVAGAETWRIATHAISFAGADYLAYLRFDQPLRRTRSLQLDRLSVEVQNANLWFANLQRTYTLEGATATLRRLYPDAGETVHLFEGRVAAPYTAYTTGRLEIVSALDPGKQTVPMFSYSPSCEWRFKSAACGYDPGGPFDECDKTVPACDERGRLVSFQGFPTMTRETQESVPPPPAPPETGRPYEPEVEIYQC